PRCRRRTAVRIAARGPATGRVATPPTSPGARLRIERHPGRAALRSHKDRCGSRLLAECWCLSVPLGMVESRLLQTQPAAPPSPPEPAARARSILVIEDEPPIRRAIQYALLRIPERVVADGAGGERELRRGRAGAATESVVTAGDLTIDLARRAVRRAGRAIHLTPLEWDIVRTLVGQAGRTLTHQQIFDAVWRRQFGNPQQYLRVYI